MCGIFAVINKNNKKFDLNRCRSSLSLMSKRGPDWKIEKEINKSVYLGQVVLSMTGNKKKDISQHLSDKNNYFILLVGEIYNHKDLNFQHLDGFADNSSTDTKILVNLFERKSKEHINQLIDGMFAYILYDIKKNSLVISRDPNGEKSLYIFEDKDQIIISSEINPILQYNKKIKLNINTLKNYFLTRHFLNLEQSIFSGIKKLEVGTQIEISLNNFKSKIISIIKINDYVDRSIYNVNLKRNFDDLLNELDFLINKNLRQMIPFNRKFASIVSGGIDSSLVSSYLCENSKPDFLIYINHIGKELHLNKIKDFQRYLKKDIYICNVNQNDYFRNYIKCINICNSPINSHSFVGQFINAKIVSKRNCRAIFGGEGADELFGGYETYLSENFNKKINFSDYTKISDTNLFSDTSEQDLFKKDMKEKWNDCLSSYYFVQNISDRQKLSMMLMDATVQMESNAFKGIDLMCMNNSVEGRSLFYRKEIVKFALNLPIKYKINPNAPKLMRTKYILKNLFLKKFSKRLILTKQGFSGFPNEMKKYAGSIDKFILNKYIKPEFLKANFYKNRSIQWKILNTELYLKFVGHKFL